MLNVNISKLIHPNFKQAPINTTQWEIYPKETPSTSIILETLRLPTEVLNDNRIFEVFVQKIEETPFIENERELLYTLRLPLLIMALTTPIPDCKQFFRYIPPNEEFHIRKFVEFYQQELKEALEDQKSRKGVLEDIQNFWGRIVYIVNECSLIGVEMHMQTLGDIPPYLPIHYIEKLTLLAMYPDYPLLISTLRDIFPRLNVLRGYRQTCVSSIVFFELLKTLPQKPPKLEFITFFQQQVWELHLYTSEVVSVVQCGKFNEREILGQVLCFMLPNWSQVWCELGWPFTHEIKKRLKGLKKQKWLPSIKDFIKCIIY